MSHVNNGELSRHKKRRTPSPADAIQNTKLCPQLPLYFQVSNTAFAAVTLSALYQVAADDGLCNSPYFLQRHPMRTQAYDKI